MTKTVYVGQWDGEQIQVVVEDTATLQQVLAQAGLSIQPSQSITRYSDASNVGVQDSVIDSETYLLTGNHTAG